MGWKIPGIFSLPQETRRKFLNMPQIMPFQITLSLQVISSQNTPDFHLALRQQRKKISEISKTEILGFEKIFQKLFNFFCFIKWKKVIKI